MFDSKIVFLWLNLDKILCMPFFSVIIPLYNKENFVLKTIDSILNQSFNNFEIIIVEDCSTDRSLSIVSRVIDQRIRVVKHSENKGLSAARNTGIKNATCNYIVFIDADDLWNPNFLEEIFQLIKTYPKSQLYATNYREIYRNSNAILPTNNITNLNEQSVIENYFELSLAQPLYCHSGFCLHKDVFDRVGFYDESIRYAEDVDFNIRANSFYKLAYSKKALVDYFMVSENQITNHVIADKKIPDFDTYEKRWPSASLKKYLDFMRYSFAKNYKMEGSKKEYLKMKDGINNSNLNWKQKLLLNAPVFVLKGIVILKNFLILKKLKLSTYN
jgi:glycosyltransferase involved in cell wall biosynthesis